MDLPTLRALEAQWAQHPPTHRLVAVIAQSLGWKPPAPVDLDAPEVQEPAQGESDDDGDPTAFLQALGVVQALPAPNAVRDAQTPEESLRAFEKLFFGEVKNVSQL